MLGEEIVENSTVTGRIVNIEDYGAFLEITTSIKGLIHISEVSWSNQPINPRDYFKVGNTHEAKIVTLDRNEKKMSLSIKQLLSNPWENIEERFPAGSRFTGEVKNITPYGIFIELAEGIGGMVHTSDISWTKRFNHPSEFTKIGEKLEVVVLSIDKEARKLSLGHKQVEEDRGILLPQYFRKARSTKAPSFAATTKAQLYRCLMELRHLPPLNTSGKPMAQLHKLKIPLLLR